MAKDECLIPEAKQELYRKLIATRPGVECKGAKSRYTSQNGHMFSFLTQEGKLALRLPEEARETLTQNDGARPCIQYGTLMKEYVLLPEALLERTADLAPWFQKSHEYVSSLKPKPTSRKKKTAKKTAKRKVKKKTKKAAKGKVKKAAATKKKAGAKTKKAVKKAAGQKKAAKKKR